MPYVILEDPPDDTAAFAPRGAAADLWRCKDHEVVIAGPAETGKTFACLHKLDGLLWKYPGATAVVIRKTLASLHTTCLRTYRNVLGPDSPVVFYGGEKPEWADYPNGSRAYFAGMDNPQKALSSERDYIYVNQAEELELGDWETLTTRCTGRAGVAPHPQILGDCNPGPPTHWILHRPSLRLLHSRHEDNPTLYGDDGHLTLQGERTLAVLDQLTGLRKARLRRGLWVQAEGAVYEFDRSVHLVDRFDVPYHWRRVRSVDFGYTNPFVCQWWAIDPDGGMWLYRELYMTGRIVASHAEVIVALSAGESIEETVADHDAEDRATLLAAGVDTIAAWKAVKPGIEAVQTRLAAGRLRIMRDCLVERDESLSEARKPTCTVDEVDGYVWARETAQRAAKEEPIKINDHGLDALRYAVCYVDGLGSGQAWSGGTSADYRP